jgi:zinc transport system ATP-binding protein
VKNPIIQFQDVSLGYKNKILLSGINFSIHDGDYLGIVGPNGVGKTTLLQSILGILKPRGGRINFQNGQNGRQVRFHFGYVPQRGQLDEIYPFTVWDIVSMGRYRQTGLAKSLKARDREKINEALEHLQRTLVARALVSNPSILILDEPTEGLDMKSQNAIMDLISHFHDEHRLTVILVSHDLNMVANYANQIAILEKNLFQVGLADEILTEENLRKLYKTSVTIHCVNGEKVILSGKNHD